MIKSIHIRNFRNIRSADIDLERLTVFVGANAVGKSSVLEVVQHCTAAAGDDPAKYFRFERHCDWLYTRGGSGDLTLECDTTAGKYGISASIAEVPDYSRQQPQVLLMDDIDQGLHPLAQRKLLQVLATSHSPYLLDGLRPEQVRCMTTDPEGYTIVNKLGDHPEFAKWQDELAPEEMWSMFGEKWMPAAEPHAARMAGVS